MTKYIGTYGEKNLHRELKWYLEPTGACHEAPVGKYIADIKTEAGITEIQTQSFYKLRNKLTEFLSDNTVILVYPLAHEKLIQVVDMESGEILRTRRSPRKGSFYDAFREIYQIKNYLKDVNLILRLILIDVTERRSENAGRWKRYKKIDTAINSFYDEIIICGVKDYAKLIPPALGGRFTSAAYADAAGINLRNAQTALNVLTHVGAVTRVGKQRNNWLYEKS